MNDLVQDLTDNFSKRNYSLNYFFTADNSVAALIKLGSYGIVFGEGISNFTTTTGEFGTQIFTSLIVSLVHSR